MSVAKAELVTYHPIFSWRISFVVAISGHADVGTIRDRKTVTKPRVTGDTSVVRGL